ncbi:MAG: hypothetical protein IJ600_03365 [Lachnospiraceae bacterium]|nr:hypothetical protein [Lachnospiraceae bacterium]
MRECGKYKSGLPDVTRYQRAVMELDEYTPYEVVDFYAGQIRMKYDVSAAYAKKLVLNAMARSNVKKGIMKEVEFLMTGGET